MSNSLRAAFDHAAVGINLAGPQYYSNEVPWEDVFKQSQPLFFQNVTNPTWGAGNPSPLRPDGYPTMLNANNEARALWDPPAGIAAGQYVLLYDGNGRVDVDFAGHEVSNTAGRVVFNLDAGPTRMMTRIVSTNQNNPVRNIRIVPIARESAYATGTPANPWRQDFTNRWAGMTSYRFMDWGATNNSTLASWSQRTTSQSQTQTGPAGVALEEMISLANHQRTNPWFNIPAVADDNYVTQFATMVRDRLDAGLVARVEYSNEVWNGGFDQANYARSQGIARNLGGTDFDKQLKFYSMRSVQIFQIFENVFTNNGANPQGMARLKRIMASQSANPYVSNLELSYNNAYQHVDALAIAPYFGHAITNSTDANFFKTASRSQIIAKLWQDVAEAMQQSQGQKTVANQYGIDLYAYEGGQHYVGAAGFENDDALTQALINLNNDPIMRDLYRSYLQQWDALGGKDFMMYASLMEQTKWGSWGLMGTMNQDPSTAYKLLGVMDYINSVSVPEPAGAAVFFLVAAISLRRRSR